MKNSTRLLNCILILTFNCLFQFVKAQIVYTDVNPDQVITNSTYHLDLNNDGIIDFDLNQGSSSFSYITGFYCYVTNSHSAETAISKNLNAIAADSIGALVLSSSSVIDSQLSWRDTTIFEGQVQLAFSFSTTYSITCHQAPSYTQGGYWAGAINKYLGLKIKVNGLTYYGWARLSFVNGLKLKDYAYNSIPNEPILAGQTCIVPLSGVSSSGDLTFCKGGSVTLSADNTATQFQWNKNGTDITGATNSFYTASESGTYTCNLSNSCVAITSDSSVVVVNKKPKATIDPTGVINMCAGSITTLLANSGNNFSYQWKKNGSTISGATNSTFDVTQAGDYKVRVTNTNTGCSKTSKATTVSITCKAAMLLTDGRLSASPNPFSNSTTISFSLSQSENVSLKIFDVEGRLIRTLVNENLSDGPHTLVWDTRDENGIEVDAGVYFLRMETVSEVRTISLSVVK